MLQILPAISPVLSGAGIMMLGYGLLGTLVAVRMSMEGVPAFISGLVMAGFFAGQVAGSLHVRRVIESIGHIRTFSALASAFSAASLVHVLQVEPITWGLLRFAEGYCMAGLFMCVESWLNDRSTNETRGGVFSIYMVIVYGANAATQFLLTVADVGGVSLFVLTSVLTSVALLPVALTRGPTPALPAHSLMSLRKLVQISPLGMVGCLTSGFVLGSFYAMGPRYGEKVGLDTFGIAVLIAGGIIGGLLGQIPLGRLSDRIDRRIVIAGVAVASALLSGLLVWVTSTEPVGAARMAAGAVPLALPVDPLLISLILLFGAMIFSLYPLSVAHANDSIDPADFVAAAGGLLLAFSVGATIGPIVASGLMELVGAAGLFLFTALSGVGLAAFALWRLRVAKPMPPEEKTPFTAAPGGAMMLAEWDPRAEDDQLSFSFDFPAAGAEAKPSEPAQG
jgi:MFS family permease